MCFNCRGEFPFSVVVDGKRINLKSRRYCLSCSPRGGGLRTRLPGDVRPFRSARRRIVQPGASIRCEACGRDYVYNCRKGHLTYICNSCSANRGRIALKAKSVEYKGGKCQRCGYEKCLRALQFHHRDAEKKEFTIGYRTSWRWARLKAELDKCDLICSNCHCEVHEEIDRLRKHRQKVPVVQRLVHSPD